MKEYGILIIFIFWMALFIYPAIVERENAMVKCQETHSFDTCHEKLNR